VSRRILVTGAGSGPSNNLMRSLLHGNPSTLLVGCNSDRFMLKKSPALRNFLLPSADGDAAGFEGALRALIESADVELIMPGSDFDACEVARIHRREPLACRVFLPRPRTIELCQDKCALSLFLRRHAIAAPRTYPVTDRATLEEAWQALTPRELAWCRVRRGFASRGATKVRDVEQAWSWISYWHTMRGIPVEEFTLSEFLPGRDFNVQALCAGGRVQLIKMCERLSYLNADHHPSGMASTPALAKTVWEPAAIATCEAALRAIDPQAQGVFSLDLKENDDGEACITEINAGRFCMITNIHDFTGRHNMAATYVRLAFREATGITDPHDRGGEHYLVRDLDTLPSILSADALFEGIERVRPARIGVEVEGSAALLASFTSKGEIS
jgi:carbamoyl-phosphate synthase large subunit